MGWREDTGFRGAPVHAWVGEQAVACVVCGADEFYERKVKLNSTFAEYVDMGWANESATGLICTTCGYVHEFVGDALTTE